MNLLALYQLLASRTNPDGSIRLPAWPDIARAAQVPEVSDAAALRALIEKGAIDRRPVPNSFSDYAYLLREPAPGFEAAFYAALQTIGASVRPLLLEV